MARPEDRPSRPLARHRARREPEPAPGTVALPWHRSNAVLLYIPRRPAKPALGSKQSQEDSWSRPMPRKECDFDPATSARSGLTPRPSPPERKPSAAPSAGSGFGASSAATGNLSLISVIPSGEMGRPTSRFDPNFVNFGPIRCKALGWPARPLFRESDAATRPGRFEACPVEKIARPCGSAREIGSALSDRSGRT